MAYAYLFCLLMEQISDHDYLIVIYQRNILIGTVYYLGHRQKSDSILRAIQLKKRITHNWAIKTIGVLN